MSEESARRERIKKWKADQAAYDRDFAELTKGMTQAQQASFGMMFLGIYRRTRQAHDLAKKTTDTALATDLLDATGNCLEIIAAKAGAWSRSEKP